MALGKFAPGANLWHKKKEMIYVSKLSNIWNRVKYGNPAFDGYTFDLKDFTPITEDECEAMTVVDSSVSVGLRRRWLDNKPDRKVTGYK